MKKLYSIVLLLVCGIAIDASPRSSSDKPLANAEAIETIRAINTAELDANLQEHKFVPLADAIHRIKEPAPELSVRTVKPAGATALVLKDYRLSLVVSADSMHYQVALTPSDVACATGFFSDESGLVFSGQPLGCHE